MSTLVELFGQYLETPDAVALMDRLRPRFEQLASAVSVVNKRIATLVQHVDALPPSPGYEPYFVGAGMQPILARGMSRILVSRGRRIAAESAIHKKVVAAIKFLAKPHRSRHAVNARIEVLVAALSGTTVFQKIAHDAQLDLDEFLSSLMTVYAGRDEVRGRLTELAALLAPRLSTSRGPKIRPESASHEFFYKALALQGRDASFTWNEIKDEFTDDMSEATRREFGLTRFDPRPARRRYKAAKKAEGKLSR